MRSTRFQRSKDVTRKLKAEALSVLGAGGAEFGVAAASINERVVIDERVLTLAMAGEYGVGKSSLIKALTGKNVAVGAGVTTGAVHSYPHEDLVLIDMPGALSGQMEHDEIAKRAIADADLILFVVSNELFNSASLPHFKFAADRLAKKHQMLLVVNKFDRFNLAKRTPEEGVQFIEGVLADEIRPLPIQDFGPVVVSCRDYLAATETDDDEKRTRRLAASRFDTLTAAIDEFSTKRGILAQQARPLQQLLEIVGEATTLALADDGSRSRAEALLRRRIFALTEARGLARTEFRKVRELARGRFVQPSEKLLKLVDSKVSQEEMDAAAAAAESELQRVVKDVGEELAALHKKLVADLRERLDEIDASPLGKQVNAEFDLSMPRPDVGDLAGGMSVKQRKAVAEGLKKTTDYLAKNSKDVAEALGQVFKFFGGKFKPWGKVNLGKFIGKAGKVLGPLVAVGEAYMNYREEDRQEQAERQVRTIRAELRAQFADAATQFDTVLREQEEQVQTALYEEPLAAAQLLGQQILAGAKGKAQVAEQLARLTGLIRSQIEKVAG